MFQREGKTMKNAFLSLACGAFLLVCSPKGTLAQAPGQNPVLGMVVKSVSAQIGNSDATEGATVYSGDFLSTKDGGSLQVRIGTLSFELQSSSSLHIYRAPYGAIAELDSGTVTYSTPGGGQNLVIVASDVRVTPVLSISDYGRVSIDDPCNVTVQSQKGQVDVRSGSESRLVDQGKAYRVSADNEISYHKYLSPDEDRYHDYHDHKPCAVYQTMKGHAPIAPGQSKFLYLMGATAIIVTTIPIVKALESASRP
jgi:hypothetical protein